MNHDTKCMCPDCAGRNRIPFKSEPRLQERLNAACADAAREIDAENPIIVEELADMIYKHIRIALIGPDPDPSVPHMIGVWRCSGCGRAIGEDSDGDIAARWRWNGNIWEHKCPENDPQCGHEPARFFGDSAKSETVPTEAAKPQKCNKPAGHLIAGASWFTCVLPEGHEGEHRRGGDCVAHGEYVGANCPKWPDCVNVLIRKQYFDQHAKPVAVKEENPTMNPESETVEERDARYLREYWEGQKRCYDALISNIQAVVEEAYPDARHSDFDVLDQGVRRLLTDLRAASSLLQEKERERNALVTLLRAKCSDSEWAEMGEKFDGLTSSTLAEKEQRIKELVARITRANRHQEQF